MATLKDIMEHFMDIKLVNSLVLSPGGLLNKENNSLVFFKQGSLDGACGLYSVAMLAVTTGLADRGAMEDLFSMDKRTIFGKWFKDKANSDGVFKGTNAKQLIKLIEAIRRQVNAKPIKCSTKSSSNDMVTGKSILNDVRLHCDNGLPSIIRLDWERGESHWVVAIGYQTFTENDDIEKKWEAILTLDPSANHGLTNAWNGVLSRAKGKPGKRPYGYWTHSDEINYCSITECILIG